MINNGTMIRHNLHKSPCLYRQFWEIGQDKILTNILILFDDTTKYTITCVLETSRNIPKDLSKLNVWTCVKKTY